MVHLLQTEVDEIRDVVEDIVSTMVRRKKNAATKAPSVLCPMAQLANDLAAMGIATADKAAAAAPASQVQEYKLRELLTPEPYRIQQVMMELQHGMMQLQHLITQGRSKSCCTEVDKVRYNIGYSLGTLVRLFYGPTNLQNNPQALPDAFGLALQQTYVAAESSLQLLIAGLSGINMAEPAQVAPAAPAATAVVV